jgi:uncharacterized protein (TIGR00159 family)
LELFDFLDLGFFDILDIVLVAVLLFYLYKVMRGTTAFNIFLGIAFIYLIWKITQMLQMSLLSDILGNFLGGGMIALLIVFQQEIRKFLLMIGSTNFATKRGFLKKFNFLKPDSLQLNNEINDIVSFCEDMSKIKTGVLIVIGRSNNLDFVKLTGDTQQIKVNKPILKSIFYKNSPLHDGAAVVENDYITATRVILPIDNSIEIPSHFGLRHRAALGITTRTDALALIVSEESGQISYVNNGVFVLFEDTEDLAEIIKEDLIY